MVGRLYVPGEAESTAYGAWKISGNYKEVGMECYDCSNF